MNRRALVALAVLATAPARADTVGTLETIGYVAVLGVSGIAVAVNGSYLAYDEPAPRGWRLLGLGAGGVDVAIAAGLFIADHDSSGGLVLGGLALGVGAAALTTALLVKEDTVRVGLQPVARGGLLTVAGRF